MKKILVSTLLGAAFMSLHAGAETASSINIIPKASTDYCPVAHIKLARDLAALGASSEDPLMLITAAQIQQSISTTSEERTKRSEGNTPAEVTEKESSTGAPNTSRQMLALASELAGENEALHDMIEEVGSHKPRGRVGGPAMHTDRVLAGDIDYYDIMFKGGEPAAVYVSGDGDTDLDLFILDENQNIICEDTDATDEMLCGWHPSWTGEFTVVIKNLGNVYNQYDLYTN